MISIEKFKILTPSQKLPKNVRDLGKIIVANGFKSCPKSNKSQNLVTLGLALVLKLNTLRASSLAPPA